MPADDSTVYVVDDDPAVRDSVLEMLDAEGLAAEGYATAASFLADFDGSRAGCVVLDICMPEVDGLVLCEQLQKEHPGIPVIMVTGHLDVAKSLRRAELGVVDLIEKPFSNRQLISLIRETLDSGEHGEAPGPAGA